jgi:predicted DNA-binding transcriptional regulator AlpA
VASSPLAFNTSAPSPDAQPVQPAAAPPQRRRRKTHVVDGPPVEPLAVRGDAAAKLCGVSPRLWRALDTSGRIPRGRRLARAKIWVISELREWLAAGCPTRDAWESRRQQ